MAVEDLGLTRKDKPDQWTKKIEGVKKDAGVIYTDDSMSEKGRDGAQRGGQRRGASD